MQIRKISTRESLKGAMAKIDLSGRGIVYVVDDDGRLEGTATDGDIRRGILNGLDVSAPIAEVMNTDPTTVRESWSVAEMKAAIPQSEIQEKTTRRDALPLPVLDDAGHVVDSTYVTYDGEFISTPPQEPSNVNTVVVIGGAGYIGSVLSRKLLSAGYDVRVLDSLTYGRGSVDALVGHDRFELVEGDMRSIETVMRAVKGADAVMHLGAIVGEPATKLEPQRTLELNYHATRLIAGICKYHQVNRFVFASTCSVYGESDSPQDRLTEQSPLNPVSLYAKSKIESERAILDMEDENFSPTVFRMATIYGLSPRMRFDLVVNILSAKAYTEGTVPIFGGDQYRPLVHVADASRAYIDCLHAPIDRVSGEVYNVGSDEQNYRILEVGEIVASCFPDAEIDRQPQQEDERTYQVSFSKIRDELGFEPEWTIPDCCEEIEAAFEEGRFEDFTAAKYNNYRSLQNDNPFLGTGETDVAESQAE